jgi:hypothetical protein
MDTTPESPKKDLPAAALEAAKATASHLASKDNVASMVDGAAKNAPLVGNVIGMVPPEQRKNLISTILDTVTSLASNAWNMVLPLIPQNIKNMLGMGGGDASTTAAPVNSPEASKPAPAPNTPEVMPSPTPKIVKAETKTLG